MEEERQWSVTWVGWGGSEVGGECVGGVLAKELFSYSWQPRVSVSICTFVLAKPVNFIYIYIHIHIYICMYYICICVCMYLLYLVWWAINSSIEIELLPSESMLP